MAEQNSPDSKDKKQNYWKLGLGLAAGIILYRVISDYLWPMVVQ